MSVTPVALNNDEKALLLEGADPGLRVEIGPERLSHCSEIGLYVVFGPKTLGGQVVIECAPFAGYGGTWAPLSTVNWTGPDKTHYYGCTGAHLAVRIRITKKVLGGSVSVYGVAN